MAYKDLHSKILGLVEDRTVWEERQRIWYQMRHEGLNRRKKPYPGAANLHYPLIDTQIEKLKPFYFNQAFSTDRVAQFVSLERQYAGAASSAADFFDYEVRQLSNLQEKLLTCTDHMLMSGRSVMKVRWEDDHLDYEAVDPIMILVPRWANRIEEADYFCHVKQLTPEAYMREEAYERKEEDFVRRITGHIDMADEAQLIQERAQREGLTYSTDSEMVLIWECYEKEKDGGWMVHTYSPHVPDEPVRKPFRLVTTMRGRPMLPFVDFPMEVKDEGWYSPRGAAERQAPFESWMCKLWNGKADSIDFYNKPMFTSENQIVNNANIAMLPGEVLPQGLKPVQMPQPPISYDIEMQTARKTAELEMNMPDASLTSDEANKEKATAAEINYRRALANQGTDMRGWVFRRSLTELYRKSWALLIERKEGELVYFTSQDRLVLPEQAAHDNYMIEPDGSPEQWNRDIRFQKAMARFQALGGHPNVNQEELVRGVIEEDDARLVKKLWVPTGMKAATEAEDEAMEVLLLMAGYPAVAMPHEDHVTRIGILVGKLEQLGMVGAPVDPVAKQRLQEHIGQHLQMLQAQNPQAGAKYMQALSEVAPENNQDRRLL